MVNFLRKNTDVGCQILSNFQKNPNVDFNLESAIGKLSPEVLDGMWASCHLYTTEAVLALLGPNGEENLDISNTSNKFILLVT